ncbi:MAG TPA: hypothetical protein VER96_02065 [Polyangiaceae bacterium]|nr:hypothetical protein [Polyangiaceae bacterium]
MIELSAVRGVAVGALMLAAGCGSSTSNGPSPSGGSGGSGGALDPSGGQTARGGQGPGVSGNSGGKASAGNETGGSGQGGQAEPKPTHLLVEASDTKNSTSALAVWSFNVDGSSGSLMYGLSYGFSLPKKRDRVLINGGGQVVLIDLDGKNRRDIECAGSMQARISPSGKYYAYTDDDGAFTYQLFVAGTDGSPAKSVVSNGGTIEWAWDADNDVLIYGTTSIDFYEAQSGKSSNISDFGRPFRFSISPDSSQILYTALQGDKSLLRVWDRNAGKGVTVYEGVYASDRDNWASDSSAFAIVCDGVQNNPVGVLAAEVTGENATFVPGAKGSFGYSSPRTFLVETAGGALEAWKLGATTGVQLFPSTSDLAAMGAGFVVTCERASGALTLVNDDGSNRHTVDGVFACDAGLGHSGRYVAAGTKGGEVFVFGDTSTPPEVFSSPGATFSVRASLRGGEGFALDAPDDKATWLYRSELGFVLARPSKPLFQIGGGQLLP